MITGTADVITPSEPSWIPPFTRPSPRQFGKPVIALRHEGADAVLQDRPRSLPLEDRATRPLAHRLGAASARPAVRGFQADAHARHAAAVGRLPPENRNDRKTREEPDAKTTVGDLALAGRRRGSHRDPARPRRHEDHLRDSSSAWPTAHPPRRGDQPGDVRTHRPPFPTVP
ncbi:hypothetical protein GCM10010497_61250 [Streptomyces cinereoruber]|uniref:Uncharacterized protein n=1 Tax=Streptomyces cinereoruber TaxID=67260 RepID=A0AAV4KR10_9ACTN|nr:hypothetical protein GCM10010497_61250 [Streptomyces cinereoruber]